MKVNIKQALQSLRTPLRQRLDGVLEQLRAAAWPGPEALCYAPGAEGQQLLPPGDWDHPQRSETDQIRFDTYVWATDAIRAHRARPTSILDALGLIEDRADQLVTRMVEIIGVCVDGLVAKKLQSAVVSRSLLVQRWPWPLELDNSGAFVHLLLALCPAEPPEPLLAAWPAYTASVMVADWAETWLRKNAHATVSEHIAQRMKETQRNTPIVVPLRPTFCFDKMVTPALALLHKLEREVEEDQERKFIAIDTCKEHTKLVESWRDLPKNKRTAHSSPTTNGRLELILPDENKKRHFQLSLDLGGRPLAIEVARCLREWRSWAGLRHWVAFQSLITRNKRLGWVRWTVDDHLAAMGCRSDRIRRLELRRAAAQMVELFTKIEIGIYDDKGKIRERRPLVLKGNTYERLVDSQWEIEGLQLEVNPLLFRGIRDPKTGKLGKNWWPTPEALPHIDHYKFGPAIALGTVLPGRWRMQVAQSGHTYIDLTGASLLQAAGLPYRPRNLVATWRSLTRNLTELQRRGGIERWEWRGEPELSTLCRLYAPQWAIDRVVHGVPPRESEAPPDALTGSELKAWRKKAGLTQVQAAERLQVALRTLKRAEAQGTRPLSKKLRAALKAAVCEQPEH